MEKGQLIEIIRKKRSFLCVGLDTDPEKIPSWLNEEYEDPVFEFNRRIIDATIDLAVAYKPNLAFYESQGSSGWRSLEKTMEYLLSIKNQKVFTIADAKRGDIGNSANHYARAFFDRMGFDAVTVSPYMGEDSVKPFLTVKGKWAIILALTSNPGSRDFQLKEPELSGAGAGNPQNQKNLFEQVMESAMRWGNENNTMFVVGATRPELLTQLREIAPDYFFLVPGVGTQGGSLQEVAEKAMTKDCGLLVNVSRKLIYASSGKDFDLKAREQAAFYQEQMDKLLQSKGLV